MMKIGWVIKILDIIHDVLCPFFGDNNKQNPK